MSDGQAITIGIDGSNLRAGGGVTHLCELLGAAEPERFGIGRVVLWGGRALLNAVPKAPWLELAHQPALDRTLPHRIWWQNVTLSYLAAHHCDLLFVPGGNYAGRFRPFVTMSRNLLPFQPGERERYGRSSWMYMKLALLRRSQSRTMRRASGVIFLTDYARQTVLEEIGALATDGRVIGHGVDTRFDREPRPQRPLQDYDETRPFRLLYVSTVDVYKHQWHVATAVAALRRRGMPVAIDFVGSAYRPALARLGAAIDRLDPERHAIRYLGPVPYSKLPASYQAADAFVFASTCETMSNVLLEAMASGLPAVVSDYGLSREVIGGAAMYFEPEDPVSIERALSAMIEDPGRRAVMAEEAYRRSKDFSWCACAAETFGYLARIHAHAVIAEQAGEATAHG